MSQQVRRQRNILGAVCRRKMLATCVALPMAAVLRPWAALAQRDAGRVLIGENIWIMAPPGFIAEGVYGLRNPATGAKIFGMTMGAPYGTGINPSSFNPPAPGAAGQIIASIDRREIEIAGLPGLLIEMHLSPGGNTTGTVWVAWYGVERRIGHLIIHVPQPEPQAGRAMLEAILASIEVGKSQAALDLELQRAKLPFTFDDQPALSPVWIHGDSVALADSDDWRDYLGPVVTIDIIRREDVGPVDAPELRLAAARRLLRRPMVFGPLEA